LLRDKLEREAKLQPATKLFEGGRLSSGHHGQLGEDREHDSKIAIHER